MAVDVGADLIEQRTSMLRSKWLVILLLVSPEFALSRTTLAPQFGVRLQQREPQVTRTLRRTSQYVDVPRATSRPSCGNVQPPEALTTPNPPITSAANGRSVKVSFIIGTDGHVHSPLILESAGIAGDRRVLQTVRTWRYRPATCNGVPTETEGKIVFSSR